MCFTATLAAREKISPSSAFGPLIGRLAPTLMVSWAAAQPTHTSKLAIAAAILDLSMNVLPYVARANRRRAIFVFDVLTFRETPPLVYWLDGPADMRLATATKSLRKAKGTRRQ